MLLMTNRFHNKCICHLNFFIPCIFIIKRVCLPTICIYIYIFLFSVHIWKAFLSQLSTLEIAFFHKRKLRHCTVCKQVHLMTNKFHLSIFKIQPVGTSEIVNIHNAWKIAKSINYYFPNSMLKCVCTQLPAV